MLRSGIIFGFGVSILGKTLQPVATLFFCTFLQGSFCSGAAWHALVLPLEGLEKNQQLGNFWQHFTMGTGPCFKLQQGRSVNSYFIQLWVFWWKHMGCVCQHVPDNQDSLGFLPKPFQLRVEENKFHINEYQAGPSSPILFLEGFSLGQQKTSHFFFTKTKVIPSWSASVARFRGERNTSCDQMVVIDGRRMFFFVHFLKISLTPSQRMR